MTSPNARKGKDFERDVTRHLQEALGGRKAAWRPHAEGLLDVGDIHVPPFVLQAKNYADVAAALRLGVGAAEVQAERAGEPFGAAVLKTRGKAVAEARVAMSLRTFVALLARLQEAESQLLDLRPDYRPTPSSERTAP